jgi:hypothetical protein
MAVLSFATKIPGNKEDYRTGLEKLLQAEKFLNK